MLRESGEKLSKPRASQGVINLPAKMGGYVWLVDKDFRLPAPGVGSLIFEAKASNDIGVGFHKDTSPSEGREGLADNAPMYEVLIGGWRNTKTAIRKLGQHQASVNRATNPDAVITSPEFDKYWVTIEHGLIAVGKGQRPGSSEILRWQDPSPFPNIYYIGLSSWNAPVQYRALQVIDHRREAKSTTSPFSPRLLVNSPLLSDFVLRVFETPSHHDASPSNASSSSTAIYAHSAVLYCCGGRLRRQLHALFGEPHSPRPAGRPLPEIAIYGVQPSDVLIALEYLYTGRLPGTAAAGHELGALVRVGRALELGWLEETAGRALAADGSLQGRRAYHHGELLLSRFLSDVEFEVDGDRLAAHRVLLALASELFYAMFTGGMREAESGPVTVRLPDVKASGFRLLLEWIYREDKGPIMANMEEEAVPLLALADRFGLPRLRELCCELLEGCVDVDNACELLGLAELYHCVELRAFCLEFILLHFHDVARTAGFGGLDPSLLLEIVMSDDLAVSCEERVFETVLRWAGLDTAATAAKDPAAVELVLSYVRYALMDREYVQQKVLAHEFVRSRPPLRRHVEAARHDGAAAGEPAGGGGQLQLVDDKVLVVVGDGRVLQAKRRVACVKELIFAFPGDLNGVCQWAGTNYGRDPTWTNPHKARRLVVECSSPPSRYTRPEVLVSKAYQTTFVVTGCPPWFALDLGEGHSLVCNYYTLRQDGSDSFVRHWALQGSNDVDPPTPKKRWRDLRVHVNDESIYSPGQCAGWPVVSAEAQVPFRFFRIVALGPSSTGANKLNLCGIELYGYFT